jgi:hypothetical protein
MNGSVGVANALRGLELTHGGLRPIPLIFQVLLLLLVSLAFAATARATEHMRHRYQSFRSRLDKHRLRHRLTSISLNPIILNGAIAIGAHLTGIMLLLLTLNLGMWGFLSAPAFAVAITETIQEFLDD